MALEICGYRGSGDDLSRLITTTWQTVYGGRAWYPIWDEAYVSWRVMDPRILDRELLVCAYQDGRLIGCLLGETTELRVGTEHVTGSLTSYLSVDPSTHHRGLAVRMLDRQRVLHRERGLRLSLGVSNSNAGAESSRFWAGVARRWPTEFALLGKHTMWSAVMDGGAIGRAGFNSFERLGSRAAALLPWGWGVVPAAKLRPWRPADLDDCLRWTLRQGESADCQMIWSRPRLSVQLDHPYARTWVAEQAGRATGFVNGYLIDWNGSQRVRVGFIELCVGEGGAFALGSMLVGAGRALSAEGAQMVVAMNAGGHPVGALLAAGFLPMDPHVQTMALLGDMATTLPRGARLHCAFT